MDKFLSLSVIPGILAQWIHSHFLNASFKFKSEGPGYEDAFSSGHLTLERK